MSNTKASSWSWKVSEEDLKNQVENYNTLKISESYKGISVLIMSGLLVLSVVLGFFNIFPLSDILYSLVIYIPILFFVYKGHRWAIITLFILWTIEKIYTLYLSIEAGGSPIPSIIWWLIVAPYIFKALKVENERKRIVSTI